MLHKVMLTLRALRTLQFETLQKVTVGEISKRSRMSYSSVRRYLQTALNSELVDCEMQDYKKTGKRVFWLTEKGIDWLIGYRELGI